jgi:hypothetical protein
MSIGDGMFDFHAMNKIQICGMQIRGSWRVVVRLTRQEGGEKSEGIRGPIQSHWITF